MGDRVSIRFVNSVGSSLGGPKGDYDAPTIFCHWGGMEFVESAVRYAQDLISERKGLFDPLDRLEPRTVTCDFLYNIDRYYPIGGDEQQRHRIASDIYIGKDEYDGDNSDNGHFDIDLKDIDKLNEMVTNISSGDYWG